MRDPDGAIAFLSERVARRLYRPLDEQHFLRSPLARQWVERGLLVPFTLQGPQDIESPRLPLVTHPSEWTDSQFLAAGRLTLQLQQEAVAAGYDLKDASAWNIVFDGCRPLFCDLLSFEPLASRRWWAAGQFARHFVLPLVLARQRGLHAAQAFRVWRDGVPPETARSLLGPSRFFGRYWPLVAEGAREEAAAPVESGAHDPAAIGKFRQGLQTSLQWMLDGAAPRVPDAASSTDAWAAYDHHREHYVADSAQLKHACVERWLERLRPQWVADLGCNTGEFSRLAAAAGARVLAVDADHDSVDRLFDAADGATRIHPMVAPLDDLGGGRGWCGSEFPGTMPRMEQRFDVVMMLALTHHLTIAAAVPLSAVADLGRRLCRGHLIVELVGERDPQLIRLCAQRRRQPGEWSLARQREIWLAAGFTVEDECALPPTDRCLLLLRREG